MSYRKIFPTEYYKDEACTILHREDGPAVIFNSGGKEWWVDGKLHREGGPAIEYEGGNKSFYLNGKYYEEEDYWAAIRFGEFV